MKYEVGDKIIVLHSDEEGKVIEILSDKMVMIEVRGVKFPAYMDQIDFPYYKMFTQKKVVTKKVINVENIKKEKPAKKVKVADGVFLKLLPVYSKDVFDDDIVEHLKIYLINNDDVAYNFDYNVFFGNNDSQFQLAARIEPISDFYLHNIEFDDISDNPRFEFVFSLAVPQKKKAEYFESIIKTNGKKIFKKIEEIREKHEPSFEYEIFLHYPERKAEEKLNLGKLSNIGYKVIDAKNAKEYLAPARSVLDLHIERIMDNSSHLSNAEIMDIQLKEFEKFYDLALAHITGIKL